VTPEDRAEADYIELCRKLALPREWQEGDSVTAPGVNWQPRFVDARGMDEVARMGPSPDLVWLPHEGQIMDLLEAKGQRAVEIIKYNDGGVVAVGRTRGQHRGIATTRKLALLRLLAAITPKEEE
jgi:hypothetical protein